MFTPCALNGTNGNGTLQAECATFSQPVNRADPNSEKITLHVARLPATALEPAADALTLINGGPGGSSIDMLVDFAGVARSFTRERDVIVIDQRGTGRSSPMSCPGVTDRADEFALEDIPEAIAACLAELPQDPRYFTTSAAVEDLEALRQALGYQQLSLYGISYGTRVAQHYMRTYPASTRAVIIDGVVPSPQPLGIDIAINSEKALQAAFKRCSENEPCQQAFPDLEDQFQILSTRLQQQEINLSLPHPVTGAHTDLQLTYEHLMLWLRFSLYAPETVALIPLTIHQAAVDNSYMPIASNALRMMHNISESMNYGMHNSVMCTEDAPFYREAGIDFETMEASYIGRELFDRMVGLCEHWPEGFRHDDIKAELSSSVPTLLLSGEFDPITPPSWAERVVPGLSNAKHIVAPGQGHGTLSRGCIPRLMLDFIETPDPNVLDDSCIKHLSAYPLFINSMGPPP